MDDFPNLVTKRYHELRQEIKSGDILLCSGNAAFSNMIKQATQSVWSHVAFILRLDALDRIMVLESVESIGVRAVPLSNYVFDYNGTRIGYEGRLMLARHRDFQEKNILNLSKTAIDLLGYPYHTEEIIRIAERISMNSLGIKNQTPDAEPVREFICSEYAYICFKSVGIKIDYNPLGFISPADFAHASRVEPLSFIQTESLTAATHTEKSRLVEAI
jgi:hypothetical protein